MVSLLKLFIKELLGHLATASVKRNVFGLKSYSPPRSRILISYIKTPFSKPSRELKKQRFYNNFIEVLSAANIFNDLGYIVDVVDFNVKLPPRFFQRYSIIYGFGEPFVDCFRSKEYKPFLIYYGAGLHVQFQNSQTLNRLYSFYCQHKILMFSSCRYVEKTWTTQTYLSDMLIVLGNKFALNTYKKYASNLSKMHSLPPPCQRLLNVEQIIKLRQLTWSTSKFGFLFFSSYGQIHKGLDIILEVFSKRSDLSLHICTDLQKEPAFYQFYNEKYSRYSNIHYHGFIDLVTDSHRAVDIFSTCSYTVSASCSEGGSPSLAISALNGALIPIHPETSSIDIPYSFNFKDVSVASIDSAVSSALSISQSEAVMRQRLIYNFVRLNYSPQNYYDSLKSIISSLKNV